MESQHMHEEVREEEQPAKLPYEQPMLITMGSFATMTRGSSGCCSVDFYLYYSD
jgi:hypothetical protein